jgi:hypothetical protein
VSFYQNSNFLPKLSFMGIIQAFMFDSKLSLTFVFFKFCHLNFFKIEFHSFTIRKQAELKEAEIKLFHSSLFKFDKNFVKFEKLKFQLTEILSILEPEFDFAYFSVR